VILPRHPDDGDSADNTSWSDRSTLLDDYWDALCCQSAADLRQQLIDRDQFGDAIASDLDVLDKLYQSGCSTRAECESSQLTTASLPESSETDDGSLPIDPWARPASPAPAVHAAVDPPQRIGKYIVVELLDSGGQADVYRVVHPEMAKECALKLAHRPMAMDTQAGRDALQREGRLLAQCNHPNLVQVFEMDVHEGHRFVVMEYVKGLTLRQFVARNRPDPRSAARLVIELAQAVAYLHDQGITHQDIKPQNVLIDDRGRPRLIDLGLARQNDAWCDNADEWIGGTASYMSPEQANGLTALIGPRTDVFGLGGLLYHLLTRRALYVGSSRSSLIKLALGAEYTPARQLNPRVPRSLERICQKALAADPERRYGTALELERALRQCLNRRRIAAGAAVALVAIAAAALWVLRPGAESVTSERGTGPTSPSALSASSPLIVLAFLGEHYRKGDGLGEDTFGPIGYSGRTIREGDGVTVTGELDTPAYCYVIALTPDGKAQLYWPREPSDSPNLSAQIGNKGWGFPLAEGAGLQAFVVLASREQLPPFKDWKGRDSIQQYWRDVAADDVHGVWEYRDGEFRRISNVTRGPLEKRKNSGLSPLRDVCEYLKKLPEIHAIRAIAFTVKPKQ
jgi:tRNA A-37 threonylcarbamoyl transferase component Bud32